METTSHNVDALQPEVRQAIEGLVGHALSSDQKLVIQILTGKSVESPPSMADGSKLPAWCEVLNDLTVEEEAALETSITARTQSRRQP
jgi:hypothetical protein